MKVVCYFHFMPKLGGRKKESQNRFVENLRADFLPKNFLRQKIYFWRAGVRLGSWVAVLNHAVPVALHVKMSWHINNLPL